jgi:polyhydroxybutyrate depolymerase
LKVKLYQLSIIKEAMARNLLLKGISYIVLASFIIGAFAYKPTSNSPADPDPQLMHWTVDGTDREALVYIPASATTKPTPVIFVFHGFGGNMQIIHSRLRFDQLWPEAIVVWPQGLITPSERLGDKPGWQLRAGVRNDCDLRFFDTMLKSLKEQYQIDDKRIYATGHSNGGGFTYLLWSARGDVLAAVAPSAAPNPGIVNSLKPKPVIQITGTGDQMVDPGTQLETFSTVLTINSCDTTGKSYAADATYYPSATGNPAVLYKHSGGHVYPQEALPVVVRFFKSIERRE